MAESGVEFRAGQRAPSPSAIGTWGFCKLPSVVWGEAAMSFDAFEHYCKNYSDTEKCFIKKYLKSVNN